MKKIVPFLLIALCPFFMGMKVVYKNQTGKIKAIGPFVDYKLDDGEGILDVPEAKPEDIDDYIIDKGKYRQKAKAERDSEKSAKEKIKSDMQEARLSGIEKLKSVVGLNDAELEALHLK